MTRLAIIADDLSSATDCGAQVVRSGLSVVVPLGGYSLPTRTRAAQVISVDTDSRSLPADQAYAKVKAASQQLVAEGWTHFYKSVDSTLRGNLGAEVEAVLDVVKPDCAIIAPAFPKYGLRPSMAFNICMAAHCMKLSLVQIPRPRCAMQTSPDDWLKDRPARWEDSRSIR